MDLKDKKLNVFLKKYSKLVTEIEKEIPLIEGFWYEILININIEKNDTYHQIKGKIFIEALDWDLI